MVLGEASESDDDSDVPNSKPVQFVTNSNTNPNQRTASSKHKLKYNTLLHYRLRNDKLKQAFLES